MTITNGYTTLANVKARLNPAGMTTSAADDSVIEDMITAASRVIDDETARTFYARTETHYYDLPDNPYSLMIADDDLLTLTTLTNGGGTVVTSSYYKLYPLNTSPKYEIRLLPSAGYVWLPSSAGNAEAAITVAGTWGYSSTTPADIAEACIQIVTQLYRGRYGQNQDGPVTITAAGVVITPNDIPKTAMRILEGYKRWTPS